MAVNQLKNKDSQNKRLPVAFGLQPAVGTLAYSNYYGGWVFGYNALGEGEWNSCRMAFYKGQYIDPADVIFHPGALATGMTTGPQVVDTNFAADVPHSRTAGISYKVPTGLADIDTAKNPPTEFKG